MSSINSVGTSLFNFLQTIAPATQTPATTSTSNTTATTPTPSTTSTTSVDPTGTSGVQGGHHHHHHGGGGSGGELFKKIEQSVTQALQAAQSSGTSGSADADEDPSQTIQDAFSKLFQNTLTAGQASGPITEGGGEIPNAPVIVPGSQQDAEGDGDAQSASQAGEEDGAPISQQAFVQTLQSFGVDPKQFFQDFQSAVQNAQNGQFDPSTAFSSFPPGTLVNTLA